MEWPPSLGMARVETTKDVLHVPPNATLAMFRSLRINWFGCPSCRATTLPSGVTAANARPVVEAANAKGMAAKSRRTSFCARTLVDHNVIFRKFFAAASNMKVSCRSVILLNCVCSVLKLTCQGGLHGYIVSYVSWLGQFHIDFFCNDFSVGYY